MTVVERFINKTRLNAEGCWIWTGCVGSNGYGTFWVEGKTILAHRMSYMLFIRPFILTNFCVCHSCDVPVCVNPMHLFLGSVADNMRDASTKKRLRYRGPTLSLSDVRAIRQSSLSSRTIAKQFGLSAPHVRKIRSRSAWKDVV